jgi:DNA-binding CsgD family transcriptional regulator
MVTGMNGNFVLVETTPPFAAVNLLPTGHSYVLGRSSKCDVVVNHPTVSRRHAELSLVQSTVVVLDLQSYNGTFVDNERVEQSPLTVGHCLGLGSVTFLLTRADLQEAVPDSDLETGSLGRDDQSAARPTAADSSVTLLSPAQLRVFQLLLAGLPEKTIARRLEISPHTVHNHIRAIYGVFGVHSRSQLLSAELQNGPRSGVMAVIPHSVTVRATPE